NRRQRLAQRTDRLFGGADDQRLAVRHPGLEAAGMVSRTRETQCAPLRLVGMVFDRVVNLRPGPTSALESESDFVPLDRLYCHDGAGDQSVELAVPLRMRAQSERKSLDTHLDDAAERVALLARAV